MKTMISIIAFFIGLSGIALFFYGLIKDQPKSGRAWDFPANPTTDTIIGTESHGVIKTAPRPAMYEVAPQKMVFTGSKANHVQYEGENDNFTFNVNMPQNSTEKAENACVEAAIVISENPSWEQKSRVYHSETGNFFGYSESYKHTALISSGEDWYTFENAVIRRHESGSIEYAYFYFPGNVQVNIWPK